MANLTFSRMVQEIEQLLVNRAKALDSEKIDYEITAAYVRRKNRHRECAHDNDVIRTLTFGLHLYDKEILDGISDYGNMEAPTCELLLGKFRNAMEQKRLEKDPPTGVTADVDTEVLAVNDVHDDFKEEKKE